MIEVKDLSVIYKSLKALNNINLKIESGETLALVGQNGAGKSSLLKVLTGLLRPTRGCVKVSGSIGWMPEKSQPNPDLRVFEFIKNSGFLKGLEGELLDVRTSDVIKTCGLAEKEGELCGTLSKGLSQRVLLASVLVGNPEILVLDEPSSGLDPLFQKKMIELVSRLKIDKTLIISTHNISEIENLSSRVVVLKDGNISFDSKFNNKGDKSYYEYF